MPSRVRPSELGKVALAAVAFATASPLAKLAHGIPFAPIAAGRCAIAAAGLLVVAPVATFRSLSALAPRHRWALVGAGLLLAAHFAFFLGGLLATSLPAAAALVSLEPLAVVVRHGWPSASDRAGESRRAWPSRRSARWSWRGARGAGQGEHALAGDLVVLVAVAVFGAYVAFARGLRDALPTASYAAGVYSVATLALLPLAFGFPAAGPVPARSTAAVVALGLVPTLVGHTLVQRAARHVPASIVALACPGETVGAILMRGRRTGSPSRPPLQYAR